MKKNILILVALFTCLSVSAQKDWSKVDFGSAYKAKYKIGGAAAKSLKANKTFINGYTVSQATTMKGSKKSASKAIYSEASIGGLNDADFQKMVDELYAEFVKELTAAGLTITDGTDVMETAFVKKKLSKPKKNEFIGDIGESKPYEGKKGPLDDTMAGYGLGGVTRDLSFQPNGKVVYLTSNAIKSGLFYGNLSKKEKVNLISVRFLLSFATFDGGRGYKSINLSTEPLLSLSMQATLVTANNSINFISYAKLPARGGKGWSQGLKKSKDNRSNAEFFGLARSADFELTADSEKYLAEVRAMISGLQKDIAKQIKAKL